MRRFVVAFLLCYCAVAQATVKFPYPQAHKYGNNTIIATNWNCNGQTASSMLKSKFIEYLNAFYEESGDYARIKFDNPSYTVSEGIGYGMIMMVYFSDNATSYQEHFDKLWNYYQKFKNGNGFMHWKINGFNSIDQYNGATDADEDVAFALVMASYQFDDTKYRTAAANLIASMRQYEFESNGMHKPGDAWNNVKNPSYVSPAAYEIFKAVDNDNSTFWANAVSANYTLLQGNAHSTTGIPTGWSDSNGNPATGNAGYIAYDYDASRAPWRWSWSYAWYGHSQASSLLSKLASWVYSKSPGDLKINMNQDGACSRSDCESNGTSVGSLSSTLIYNSSYQEKLNNNFTVLLSKNPGYYHSSLRLLTGLLMTGNMQNFANNYTNQPYTFTMTEEMEESCKETPKEYHENSGNYGWMSTTAVLTDELADGVHIGATIRSTNREIEKELGEVTEGEKYTLSFDIKQDPDYTSMIYYRIHLYDNDDSRETDYCAKSLRLEPGTPSSYTCEFDAVMTANPIFQISLNANDLPEVTLFNLKLISVSGEEILVPEGILLKDPVAAKASFSIVGKNVAYSGISGRASLNVIDLQGRVLLKRQVHGSGVVDLSSLHTGAYVVQLKGAGVSETRKIQLR